MNLQAGDRVKVLDTFGVWHNATADSEVQPGHKLRIVWVIVDGWPDDRMPWPADSVRDRPKGIPGVLIPTESDATRP